MCSFSLTVFPCVFVCRCQFETIKPRPLSMPDRPGRHGLDRLGTVHPDFAEKRRLMLALYMQVERHTWGHQVHRLTGTHALAFRGDPPYPNPHPHPHPYPTQGQVVVLGGMQR
jgi:hypothetical protein